MCACGRRFWGCVVSARSLRVLVVAPAVPPALGGVETHVWRLSCELAFLGHSVTVVGSFPSGGRLPDTPAGVRVVGVRRPSWLPLPVSAVGVAWRVRELLSREPFDVVHLHSYHQPHAALVSLVSGSSVPVVFTGHYHGGGHSAAARLAHPLYRVVLGRRLFSRASRVVCVSASEQGLVERDFGRAAAVVPNGVDLPAGLETYSTKGAGGRGAGGRGAGAGVVAGLDDGEVVVLAVGRLERYKGVDVLVDAFELLGDLPARLVVVGEGGELDRLRSLAGSYGGRVSVLGRVSDDVLASLWERADVFVSASSDEAFGIAAATAVKMGLPAVLSDIPAHRELAGSASCLAGGSCSGGVALVGRSGLARDVSCVLWAVSLRSAVGCVISGVRSGVLGGCSGCVGGSGSLLSWAEVTKEVAEVYLGAADASAAVDASAADGRAGGRML